MLTESEALAAQGCWLEGSRGWRAAAPLVDIAAGYGMPVDEDDRTILAAYMDSRDTVTLASGESVDSQDCTIELTDRAEAWLNEHVAPAGWSFGWSDGEFFLWTDADWSNVDGGAS